MSAERCRHPKLRTYDFGCDGATYLAIECPSCPASTSLMIEDHRHEIDVDEFNERIFKPGYRPTPVAY